MKETIEEISLGDKIYKRSIINGIVVEYCPGNNTYSIETPFIAKSEYITRWFPAPEERERSCYCSYCNNTFYLHDVKNYSCLDSSYIECPFCEKNYQCHGYDNFIKLCKLVDEKL